MVLAKEIGDLEKLKEINLYLSTTCEETGRHKQALAYFKNFIVLRDSLFNEENTKKTVRLEMNYEFDKKEASEKLEQEKK